MKRMVRYKVKPGLAEENEAFVRQVFAGLAEANPAGLAYATFRLDDGVSFMHIVSTPEGGDSAALTSLPAFKAFVAGIRARCEEPPATVELKEIGAYGFFPA